LVLAEVLASVPWAPAAVALQARPVPPEAPPDPRRAPAELFQEPAGPLAERPGLVGSRAAAPERAAARAPVE